MADANQRPGPPTGLLIDWGGVLTVNPFEAYGTFCRAEGIDVARFAPVLNDPQARAMVHRYECGQVSDDVFGAWLCEMLAVPADRTVGFLDRMSATLLPDDAMVAAVRAARTAGIRTSLVSNSWTMSTYPRDLLAELFDDILISGELGIRKPDPEIYELAMERAGLPAAACVFVDDFVENVTAARAFGMTGLHHTDPTATIAELQQLFGVPLAVLADQGTPPPVAAT